MGSRRAQSLTLAEIIEWLTARRLAKQQLPERLIVLAELPRTASGKVQKSKLRDLAGHLKPPRGQP
jgi:cyclohexanecarboxylate-CoA ligase